MHATPSIEHIPGDAIGAEHDPACDVPALPVGAAANQGGAAQRMHASPPIEHVPRGAVLTNDDAVVRGREHLSTVYRIPGDARPLEVLSGDPVPCVLLGRREA